MPSDDVDTYICLLLHVLLGGDDQIVFDDDTSSVSNWVEEQNEEPSFWSKIKNFFTTDRSNTEQIVRDAEIVAGMDEPQTFNITPLAQHHYPDRRVIRDGYKHSRDASLSVAVEQVSIFLIGDGTLITFFQVLSLPWTIWSQQSGKAIEKPIVQRLSSDNTILRTSEDASMLLQSVIDAVVDLSFPIASAYQELIADLVRQFASRAKKRKSMF
jgi:hypothetical protein